MLSSRRSEVVVRELEREIVDKARRSRAETFMARALECFDAGVVFVDTSQPEWRALHCSSAFTKVRLPTKGTPKGTIVDGHCSSAFTKVGSRLRTPGWLQGVSLWCWPQARLPPMLWQGRSTGRCSEARLSCTVQPSAQSGGITRCILQYHQMVSPDPISESEMLCTM
jgi:hypothetical protein